MSKQDLNKEQIKAIEHASGPIQVLAGPGSGKTYLTIRRIRHLIQHHGISPDKILVITFTKSAATEMKERFYKLTNEAYKEVHFGTFHSVFFHILRKSGKQNLSLASVSEKYKYVTHILRSMNIDDYDNNELLGQLIQTISRIKNKAGYTQNVTSVLGSHADMNSFDDNINDNIINNFPSIYKEYLRIMRQEDKIDFDDMILLCAKLLQENASVLHFWQNAFSHILVDEFQDISPLQYQILKNLALPNNNLFVVGDDDQSIYGFRGAGPGIMKQFTNDYPDTCQIALEMNYRSGESIVTAAGVIIKENKNRYHKTIKAFHNESGTVKLLPFPTKEEENQYIINKLLQKNIEELSHSAIIYRTNAEAASCSRMLTSKNIPYCLHEKVSNLFEHFIFKDIFAYLNFAYDTFYQSKNIGKRSDFLRFMNKPLRYISRESVSSSSIVTEKSLLSHYCNQDYMRTNIKKGFMDLKRLSILRPYLAIDYIRYKIGYETYLCNGKKREEQLEIQETINEIQKTTVNYHTLTEWKKYVEEYSEILSEKSKSQGDDPKGVQLLTMHASKGLEYETVYLPNIKKGSLPNKKAVSAEALEEERRLLYVAMTRAKISLEILYNGEASTFIEKLKKGELK